MTLSIAMSMAVQQPQLNINTFLDPFEVYSDARTHGYQGETRKVRLARVTPPGGGAISKSEDGMRCVVTGKETLRILRVSDPASEQQIQGQNGTGSEQQQGGQQQQQQHKYAVGKGGYRIDASRNFWEGSGLKIDSASTDVAWGHGVFNNKILTSARNGELILWDLNKSGGTKYERRTKDHIRSIHKLSVSHVVHHYCVTGSADGHLRVWDLRDLSKSIMRVHHPTSVRSLVFSPSLWQPLQAVVGLDNGSIYRWDLKMGQRGLLDRLPVAHTASVTALDWCSANVVHSQGGGQADAGGLGWIVSGGLDRCVKVWDLTPPGTPAHIPQKPTYTLHPSFAVRRLAWRPGYECELAVVSNTEYSTPSGTDISPPQPSSGGATGLLTRVGSGLGLDSLMSLYGAKEKLSASTAEAKASSSSGAASGATPLGDTVEIWDVRRGWLAKWSVTGSSVDGGVTDIAFNDSHALWTQHASGSFAQFDLRETTMPIDSIPRVATAWDPYGSMTFVVDKKDKWEVPYDDIAPEKRAPGEITKLPSDPPLKALGDPKATISTQSVANYDFGGFPVDVEAWSDLARGYIHEDLDRREICAHNASLAFDAGHILAGQAWLLLGAALAQYVPDVTPPSSPLAIPDGGPLSPGLGQPSQGYSFPASSAPLNQSNDATTTGMTNPPRKSTSGLIMSPNSPAAKLAALSASSTSLHGQVQKQFSGTSSGAAAVGSNLGGGGMGSGASSSGGATPQPLHKPTPTPTSSTSPSPRQFPGSLPPSYSRRASFFGRPDPVGEGSSSSSSAVGVGSSSASAGGGGGGVPGRPSIAASSPGDRSVSMSSLSLRQVGEGVLDDSDSEDEEEDRVLGMTDEDSESESGSGSDEEEGVVLVQPPRGQYRPVGPLLSPGLVSPVNGWPGTGGAGAGAVASGSGMVSGSGVGGVGGPAVGGSVRTVTRALVGEVPGSLGWAGGALNSKAGGGGDGERRQEGEFEAIGLGLENNSGGENDETGEGGEEGYDMITPKSRTASSSSVDVLPGVPSSRPVSALIRSSHLITGEGDTERISGSAGRSPIESDRDVDRKWGDEDDYQTERAAEVVEFDESVFRERTLSVLMDALEEFADEGDVQTCALLALVAPEELKVSRKRLVRKMDEGVKPTLQNTIIYTSCAKCRKPLVVRAGKQGATKSSRGLGAYSLCEECDSSVVKCCICQLPVRIGTTPLFHCAICNHGGHEACYKQYYATKRRAEPPQSAKSTATTTSSSSKKGRKKKKKQTSIGSGVLQRAKLARKRPALEVEEWDEDEDEDEDDEEEEHAEDGEDDDEDDEGSEESDHGVAAAGGGGGGDKLGVGLALAGQPCAAGCGHHCWAGQGKKGEKVGMVKV
ncbi:WD40 repeat-like protein [Agrocybe pediades]|nr:WD40 repeat-like protein [Agrocybe pediades]